MALTERTRERVPLDWAITQYNLALVYRALFDKDQQRRHLNDALAAADGALEEFRKANATFYIDEAERDRAEILALKGRPGVRYGKRGRVKALAIPSTVVASRRHLLPKAGEGTHFT
jgi:hypothetical protein